MAAVAGGLTSAAAVSGLQTAEAEKAAIDARLAAHADVDPAAVALPDEGWVAARLVEWAKGAAGADGPQSLLQLALASAVAEPAVATGKARGFVRLRFRVRAWAALAAAAGTALPAAVRGLVPEAADDGGPEFTIDLSGPTAMDRWAPQIAAWRADGVTWAEIVRRTGMDLNRVYRAWKRFTDAGGTSPAA